MPESHRFGSDLAGTHSEAKVLGQAQRGINFLDLNGFFTFLLNHRGCFARFVFPYQDVFEQEEPMKPLIAKDIMTRDVLEVRAEWSLDRLAEFLIENSISGAPVVSHAGKLVGVVSLTDIVLTRMQPVKVQQAHEPHEYYLQTLEHQYGREEIASFQVGGEPLITVHDIMTPTIYKVDEDTTVPKVAEVMIRNRIHRVFVTREEEIVGIIATPDMLKVIKNM